LTGSGDHDTSNWNPFGDKLGLPAKKPPFNLPDCPVVRLAGRTMPEARLEHPEEPDHRIKSVIPL
jgi:hypothetical protein